MSLIARSSFSVHLRGILDHRLDRHPAPVLQPLEEAAVTPRMAGDSAALLDLEQNHVLVAVESYLPHRLDVARLLAFLPQAAARARPVVRLARRHRLGERLAVH